ncbi:NAD-dependent epimerase/dehydratase family protein [Aestuariibacter sp. GS-14]|uniref:GDP-mannose 4,6-dehydratase n=1 Tax=Aestuariibacter sp. GS-14 TaxID=2590670 RepID=UPI001127E2AF|nr:GDP-mannose 4,6-dehydratase [Aestuariibacter sp. GS-14]TPV55133.1 NAD-dependent epimerase/dehydratase family protein [Aestuariibacter sp. GS-14]
MKKVLVTGLDSFTGYYVNELLVSAGYDVFGYCRQNPNNDAQIIQGDLLSPDRLEAAVKQVQPNFVIHLAAVSSVQHSDKLDIYRTNVIGTLNLLEAIKKAKVGITKIILASSANIYGNKTEGMISESHPAEPVNEYAASKAAMEMAIKPYAMQLPITVVRPFNYTGVSQSRNFLIPKIVSHFVEKKSVLELGNIDVSRDFSDVRDISQYYVGLLENEEAIGKIFNLCSGVSHKLADVIGYLESISGHRPEIKINQDFVRKNDVKVLLGDNTILLKTIHKKPNYTLMNTLEWMYFSK